MLFFFFFFFFNIENLWVKLVKAREYFEVKIVNFVHTSHENIRTVIVEEFLYFYYVRCIKHFGISLICNER